MSIGKNKLKNRRGCACNRTRPYQQTSELKCVSYVFVSVAWQRQCCKDYRVCNLYSVANEQFREHGFGYFIFAAHAHSHFPSFYIVFNSQPVECDGHSVVSMLHWFRTEKSLKCKWIYFILKKRAKLKSLRAVRTWQFILKNWNVELHWNFVYFCRRVATSEI